ncbi:MAG TPA: hypothetical protein VJV04_08925 [Nitrospiraceae bacterium]|nr:hypothetical protein [Nitrospiraceae bacterium]
MAKIMEVEIMNPGSSEKKGIADILIRKHRNSPTGDHQLVFLDKFPKFDNLPDRETF